MTTAYRRIKTQAAALATISGDVLERIPSAVDGIRDEIHAIDGLAGHSPAANAGRSKGTIGDPTFRAADTGTASRRAELVDELAQQFQILQTIALSFDMLRGFNDRYAKRILPQALPACRVPRCDRDVATYALANGKRSPRGDGLCDAHRMAEHRKNTTDT